MPEDPNKKINLNLPQFKSRKNSRLFFMGERGNRHGGIHDETFMGARWTTDLPISDRVSFSPTVTAGKVNVDIPPIRHAHVPGEINKFKFPILGGGIKIKLGKKYGGDNISSNKAAKILDHGYIRNKPLTFKQRAFFGSKLNRSYGGLIKKYENGGDINTQIPLNIQPQDKLIKPKDIKMRGSSKYTIDSDYYYRNRKNAKIIKPVQNFLIQQGFLSKGDNDGFWGAQTEGALQDYITDQHISNFEWGENFTPSSDFLRKKVFTESGGYSDVKSSAGALGLMQFMPKNVKEFQKGGRYFDEVRTGWSASNNADAILGSQLYIKDLAENYGIITPNMDQKAKEAFLNIAYNWSPDGAMYLRDHIKTLTYPSGEKKGQKVDINDVNYWLPYIEKNRGFEGGWRYLKDEAGEPIYKKHWWTAEEIKAEKNPEKKKKMRGGWKWTKQYELDDKGEKIPASWHVPTETTNYARISHGMADPSNEKVTKKLSDLKDWNYQLSDLIRDPRYIKKKEWGGYSQSHLSRLLEQGGDPGKTEPPENSYPELTGKGAVQWPPKFASQEEANAHGFYIDGNDNVWPNSAKGNMEYTPLDLIPFVPWSAVGHGVSKFAGPIMQKADNFFAPLSSKVTNFFNKFPKSSKTASDYLKSKGLTVNDLTKTQGTPGTSLTTYNLGDDAVLKIPINKRGSYANTFDPSPELIKTNRTTKIIDRGEDFMVTEKVIPYHRSSKSKVWSMDESQLLNDWVSDWNFKGGLSYNLKPDDMTTLLNGMSNPSKYGQSEGFKKVYAQFAENLKANNMEEFLNYPLEKDFFRAGSWGKRTNIPHGTATTSDFVNFDFGSIVGRNFN